MKLQSQVASCGPAAMSAALEALGIERTEAELITVCKTTKEGTDWNDMLTALQTVSKSEPVVAGKPFEDNAEVALLRLLRALDDGHPVIACVSEWSHYIAVVGRLGSGIVARVVAFDPASSESMHVYSLNEFMTLWRGPKGVRKPYCGIVV